MYLVRSTPVQNSITPSAAMAVASMTIRRRRVLSRSAWSIPSAASASTPTHPASTMRPRSAPFCSAVGTACRLADMYAATTAPAKIVAATRTGCLPRSSPRPGCWRATRYQQGGGRACRPERPDDQGRGYGHQQERVAAQQRDRVDPPCWAADIGFMTGQQGGWARAISRHAGP